MMPPNKGPIQYTYKIKEQIFQQENFEEIWWISMMMILYFLIYMQQLFTKFVMLKSATEV